MEVIQCDGRAAKKVEMKVLLGWGNTNKILKADLHNETQRSEARNKVAIEKSTCIQNGDHI